MSQDTQPDGRSEELVAKEIMSKASVGNGKGKGFGVGDGLKVARQALKNVNGFNRPLGVGHDGLLGSNFELVKVNSMLDKGKHKAV